MELIRMTSKSPKKRARGRGAVLVIAMMLISSAVLRIGGGTGQAVAQALTQPMKSTAAVKDDHAMAETPKTGVHQDGSMNRAEVGSLLGALREREVRVKALESQMDIRRKALEVADEEIRKRLETLQKAESDLRQTLALADGAAENDLIQLTTVYENMKPKDAAKLFATMEPDFAAGFLGRMRPDAAAAIMTGLPPDVAYSISAILAGRNANVPKT